MPQTVPTDDLQSANALLRLALNATNIGGAALGGLLVAAAGPGWAIALRRAQLPRRRCDPAADEGARARARTGTSFVHELGEGWREFSSRTWIWVVVLGFAFANAAEAGALNVLGPVIAKESLGGASVWGLVLAADRGRSPDRRPDRPPDPARSTSLRRRRRDHTPVPAARAAGDRGTLARDRRVHAARRHRHRAASRSSGTPRCRHTSRTRSSPAFRPADAIGSLVLIPAGYAIVGPLSDAIGIDETLYLCAGIVLVAITAQLLSRQVRELPRLPPVPEAEAV